MDQEMKKQSELMFSLLEELLTFEDFKQDIQFGLSFLDKNPSPNWLRYNHRNPGDVVPPYLIIEKNQSFRLSSWWDNKDPNAVIFHVNTYDKILRERSIDSNNSRGKISFYFDLPEMGLDIDVVSTTERSNQKQITFSYTELNNSSFKHLFELASQLKTCDNKILVPDNLANKIMQHSSCESSTKGI